MIRGGFLSEEDRKALLDGGMGCQEVAKVLFFDDDAISGGYDRRRSRRPNSFPASG